MLSPCRHTIENNQILAHGVVACEKTAQYVLFEAWERMTFGGVFIKGHSSTCVLRHDIDEAWYLAAY